MDRRLIYFATIVVTLQIIGAERPMCPSDPNCICGGTLAIELNCNIDGRTVKINLLPNIYIEIKCENVSSLDYSKLPKCANDKNTFKSVSFKDCPLPTSSFKDVLTNIGVSKTMALIFQNAKNLSGYFDRKHFTGLQDLTKLLLSIKGVTHLPNNLFTDINKLTWLNIRSNSINLSEELFKPLERLETLEISHNHMTNISSSLFSHLSFLRKLSLWQSNVTWFSKDLFSGIDVLEELDLSSNGLNELPASIFKPLKRLKKLTLFSNKFSSLPSNLFKNNKELETVVILNNDVKLKELPKYFFGNLTYLTQIYMQRSGLEVLPSDVFADSQQITNISLAHNDIKVLPEAVFNDQVNLLDLDLSYNELTELKPRLFSSLLKLERLDLCHNLLVEISGSIFTALYSLLHLNMENNNLRKISTNLFRNTGLSMSVSFAYNKLKFEETVIVNKTKTLHKYSPFSYTYKLKLLNLSHNEFEDGFSDWWINGHENLDISHNNIKNLWDKKHTQAKYKELIKKPPRRVWLANNQLDCTCRNYQFIRFLQKNPKTKIMDIDSYNCPDWNDFTCSPYYLLYISLFTILGTVYVFIVTCCFLHKRILVNYIKKKMGPISGQEDDTNGIQNVILKYSEFDEEFVLKEILPDLQARNKLNINIHHLKIGDNDDLMENVRVKNMKNYKTIVVFSENYLISNYSHVDVRKIYTDMAKALNTVYLYYNVESYNSLYAYLMDQRDVKKAIVWQEPNFWDRLLNSLIEDSNKTNIFFGKDKKNINRILKRKNKMNKQKSDQFLQPVERSVLYDMHLPISSQV